MVFIIFSTADNCFGLLVIKNTHKKNFHQWIITVLHEPDFCSSSKTYNKKLVTNMNRVVFRGHLFCKRVDGNFQACLVTNWEERHGRHSLPCQKKMTNERDPVHAVQLLFMVISFLLYVFDEKQKSETIVCSWVTVEQIMETAINPLYHSVVMSEGIFWGGLSIGPPWCTERR